MKYKSNVTIFVVGTAVLSFFLSLLLGADARWSLTTSILCTGVVIMFGLIGVGTDWDLGETF